MTSNESHKPPKTQSDKHGHPQTQYPTLLNLALPPPIIREYPQLYSHLPDTDNPRDHLRRIRNPAVSHPISTTSFTLNMSALGEEPPSLLVVFSPIIQIKER